MAAAAPAAAAAKRLARDLRPCCRRPPCRIPTDGNKARYIAKPDGCQPDGLYSDGTACVYTPEMRRWDYFKKVRRQADAGGLRELGARDQLGGVASMCHSIIGSAPAKLPSMLASRPCWVLPEAGAIPSSLLLTPLCRRDRRWCLPPTPLPPPGSLTSRASRTATCGSPSSLFCTSTSW